MAAVNDDEVTAEEFVDAFEEGLKQLEESWFNKATSLKSFLISPLHDAAAKGNVDKLQGKRIQESSPATQL